MVLFNSHVTSFLLLSLLGIRSFTSASPTYSAYYCPNNATYQSSTAFQNNLNLLISSLTSNASEGRDGAYQTNIGLGTADVASGLFLCRGDVSYATCAGCVATAAEDISRRCPNQTRSVIWYDECMLGYTNRYFNPVSIVPRVNLWDGNNVSDSDFDSFNGTLFSLLDSLAEEASSSQSGKKFATDERNYSGSSGHTTLYGLAQCAPSLTNAQCEECLKNGIGTIPMCCGGKQGARALLAWCYIRYESYKFYNSSGTSASPLLPPTPSGEKKSGSKPAVLIVVIVGVLATLICLLGYFLLRRAARKTYNTLLRENFGDESATLESLQFSLGTIEAATSKFSYENKIGNGGFGEVYKGILSDGGEIAVKRLSQTSGQGVVEFKNEILLIAKLQHRNLVTLLGFCWEEQEKLLIYEFVPNKSLDYFLFDPHKSRSLNWFERYKIIQGIARGILYLHEHSRLKVIHRDLKPSNILLDNNMDPKISDFGMAKMVALDQEQGNTNRIVGTFGYMPPEYIKYGHFSEKSDIFSFGVIVLEVISAKKNGRSLGSGEDDDDLLCYAWRLCRDETPLKILDQDVKESCSYSEVIKCIQIGLLCVQQKPEDRPTMAKVVSYLSSPLAELPFPGEPTRSMHNNGTVQKMVAGESSSGSTFSVNEMSVSKFIPR